MAKSGPDHLELNNSQNGWLLIAKLFLELLQIKFALFYTPFRTSLVQLTLSNQSAVLLEWVGLVVGGVVVPNA